MNEVCPIWRHTDFNCNTYTIVPEQMHKSGFIAAWEWKLVLPLCRQSGGQVFKNWVPYKHWWVVEFHETKIHKLPRVSKHAFGVLTTYSCSCVCLGVAAKYFFLTCSSDEWHQNRKKPIRGDSVDENLPWSLRLAKKLHHSKGESETEARRSPQRTQTIRSGVRISETKPTKVNLHCDT